MPQLETSRPRTGRAAPSGRWTTPVGVEIVRTTELLGSAAALRTALEDTLDERRGMLLFRGPDRIIGYTDPPVEITATGQEIRATALNARGRVLLPALLALFSRAIGPGGRAEADGDTLRVRGGVPDGTFAEEDRTRQVGVFAAIRSVVEGLALPDDQLLGLYGAFGYDLIFQVDPVALGQQRGAADRDMVLHLPDTVYELDLKADEAIRHDYEFRVGASRTDGLDRATPARPFVPATEAPERDHAPGEYARVVEQARPLFRSGDLFEVVPSQSFHRVVQRPPSRLFRTLRERNPAPHSLLMNLAQDEYLVGASPEMFVRVTPRGAAGALVETSPISGTIARGRDALEDAERIRTLLNSSKDEHELTMCTDVDRNDKSRVCLPGTVQVTARRRIEKYSTLIHTVDRVEGVLRPDRDALDAFLAHLWAVTVTGAPKLSAIEFIERHERSPRRWYGGAVGRIGFDGGLDTVLTLRTIHLHDGVATVRAGATLLHDSSPEDEELETELKAKALLGVLDEPAAVVRPARVSVDEGPGAGRRILLVDHRDSFVHCLAGYLRETGAEVGTYRSGGHLPLLAEQRPDLVVLSPGPGTPSDFGTAATLAEAERLGIPVFGVCLGLQGIVEYLGGTLGVLPEPVHGKPSRVRRTEADSMLLDGLPKSFTVGRYHSLYADPATLPDSLRVTAATEDGRVAMAVEAPRHQFAAVQFHPESIMTNAGHTGRQVVHNAVAHLTRTPIGALR
ncbi:Anthranilate synthase [Streptomyces davaonensis JCM 4913]|uniref:Anthranilate synthase n=1 Tax=Streptomyces davaonensis (strain DSM 101723 / JCM 4913 / KCC S-0913 / 768) TaxID=1214101 RepID=K4R656_STRDJ|nr:anthranilate synthase component I [Streptomyces davaonensis]CCK28803.1 Anthranilate synthase [Streptomyces davaonensis JCM 4913]